MAHFTQEQSIDIFLRIQNQPQQLGELMLICWVRISFYFKVVSKFSKNQTFCSAGSACAEGFQNTPVDVPYYSLISFSGGF